MERTGEEVQGSIGKDSLLSLSSCHWIIIRRWSWTFHTVHLLLKECSGCVSLFTLIAVPAEHLLLALAVAAAGPTNHCILLKHRQITKKQQKLLGKEVFVTSKEVRTSASWFLAVQERS